MNILVVCLQRCPQLITMGPSVQPAGTFVDIPQEYSSPSNPNPSVPASNPAPSVPFSQPSQPAPAVQDRPQDLLPEDFLRPPSYYDNKCKNSVMAMNQEQQDHLMAMQLQQQMLDNQANQRMKPRNK